MRVLVPLWVLEERSGHFFVPSNCPNWITKRLDLIILGLMTDVSTIQNACNSSKMVTFPFTTRANRSNCLDIVFMESYIRMLLVFLAVRRFIETQIWLLKIGNLSMYISIKIYFVRQSSISLTGQRLRVSPERNVDLL